MRFHRGEELSTPSMFDPLTQALNSLRHGGPPSATVLPELAMTYPGIIGKKSTLGRFLSRGDKWLRRLSRGSAKSA